MTDQICVAEQNSIPVAGAVTAGHTVLQLEIEGLPLIISYRDTEGQCTLLCDSRLSHGIPPIKSKYSTTYNWQLSVYIVQMDLFPEITLTFKCLAVFHINARKVAGLGRPHSFASHCYHFFI